jgi:hypothetical protein
MIASYRCVACLLIALLSVSGARACSWDQTITDEQRFDRASSVFIAHVVRTEEIEPPSSGLDAPIVRATFRTIEVFKGQPPADSSFRSLLFQGGNCTLPVLAGVNYLIFLRDGDAFIDFPSGSRGFLSLDRQDDETRQILDTMRRLRERR